MKTFKSHLKNKLKNKEFKEIYDEERQLIELSLKIIESREKRGLSQTELAGMANITQQQLSKVENGTNCNMTTFLKICNALGLQLNLNRSRKKLLSA